jgi:hypothetical protein
MTQLVSNLKSAKRIEWIFETAGLRSNDVSVAGSSGRIVRELVASAMPRRER